MTDVSNVMSDERRVFVSAHCEVCRTSLASLADSELLEESVAAVRSVGTLISPTSSLKTTRSGHKHNLYALPLKKTDGLYAKQSGSNFPVVPEATGTLWAMARGSFIRLSKLAE